ncbi:hypothetical protein G9A89_014858 [Geosiphon pyriformis]|nr:hypothetical protein G9A89_014858 [Geosiphon pyriformis]
MHRSLLYTLPIGTTAHDLSGLLESYGEKTCFIGHNSSSYVCNRYAGVCFKNETSKLAAINSIPVYKDVNLCWAGFSLACCTKCKQLGHISTVCSLSENSGACGKQMVISQDQKKQAPIVCPVSFGGKTWTQIASSYSFCVVLSGPFCTGSFSGAKSGLLVSNSLECSLELLTDQVLAIITKLSFMELVLLASNFHVPPLVVFAPVVSNLDLEMALDRTLASSFFSLSVVITDSVANLSSSSSKVLTTKMGKLESKMVALEVSVEFVLERLDYLCSVLGLSTSLSPQ